jgi:23S rRNA (pseudouridine1915-N3)-methyltransferase
MQLLLLSIGKTNLKGVHEIFDEYKKRLSRFCKFDSHELPDIKKGGALNVEQLIEKESDSFLSSLKPNDFVILLDDKGILFNSEELAMHLNTWQMKAQSRIVFIIGGAYGVSKELKKRADITLSLSPLTFNHQMIRAIFCEQLYRAYTIQRGLPYHHA